MSQDILVLVINITALTLISVASYILDKKRQEA